MHIDTEPSWEALWADFTPFWMPESAIVRDGGTGKMVLWLDTGSKTALSNFQNQDSSNQVK